VNQHGFVETFGRCNFCWSHCLSACHRPHGDNYKTVVNLRRHCSQPRTPFVLNMVYPPLELYLLLHNQAVYHDTSLRRPWMSFREVTDSGVHCRFVATTAFSMRVMVVVKPMSRERQGTTTSGSKEHGRSAAVTKLCLNITLSRFVRSCSQVINVTHRMISNRHPEICCIYRSIISCAPSRPRAPTRAKYQQPRLRHLVYLDCSVPAQPIQKTRLKGQPNNSLQTRGCTPWLGCATPTGLKVSRWGGLRVFYLTP
jgi:hypothetical protein